MSRTYTIDDGTKEITIVNKYQQQICQIHFRPSDMALVKRYNEVKDRIEDIVKPLTELNITADGKAVEENDWAVLNEAEQKLIEMLNYILDSEDAGKIFEKRSAFSAVGGTFFMNHVLDVISKVISDGIEKEVEDLKKTTAQYTKDLA